MIAVVTATVDHDRAEPCLQSWRVHATHAYPQVVIENRGMFIGPVAAFRNGVEAAMKSQPECDLVACFHDDLVILEQGWDQIIEAAFAAHPEVGLASFSGYTSLGADNLYHAPYNPAQLEGTGLVSSPQAQTIVAPEAYCLIGRRVFWSGFYEAEWRTKETRRAKYPRPWAVLDDMGVVNHAYAAGLACLARRGGWQVRYLPVRCRHLAGQTTVRDPGYQAWAAQESEGGDRGFFEAAHRLVYEAFRDELPLRL